jgi:hypothetical protein
VALAHHPTIPGLYFTVAGDRQLCAWRTIRLKLSPERVSKSSLGTDPRNRAVESMKDSRIPCEDILQHRLVGCVCLSKNPTALAVSPAVATVTSVDEKRASSETISGGVTRLQDLHLAVGFEDGSILQHSLRISLDANNVHRSSDCWDFETVGWNEKEWHSGAKPGFHFPSRPKNVSAAGLVAPESAMTPDGDKRPDAGGMGVDGGGGFPESPSSTLVDVATAVTADGDDLPEGGPGQAGGGLGGAAWHRVGALAYGLGGAVLGVGRGSGRLQFRVSAAFKAGLGVANRAPPSADAGRGFQQWASNVRSHGEARAKVEVRAHSSAVGTIDFSDARTLRKEGNPSCGGKGGFFDSTGYDSWECIVRSSCTSREVRSAGSPAQQSASRRFKNHTRELLARSVSFKPRTQEIESISLQTFFLLKQASMNMG